MPRTLLGSQHKAAEVMSLLLGHRCSHETLSALTDEVLGAAEAFRRRLLPEEMAFVHLDGPSPKVFKGRRGDCAGNRVRGRGGHAFRGAAGPGVLAVAHGERAGWERVLRELWQRGLAGPALRHRRATRAP